MIAAVETEITSFPDNRQEQPGNLLTRQYKHQQRG